MTRRFFAPEVVQTSAMDCGPASLASLLSGFGVRVSYGRLREACQTDVDGTSIDVLEAVANRLGLECEQVMLPVDHLLLSESAALPAIVVTRQEVGFAHFVVVWRRHGHLIQVMDPGTGRRWPRASQFLRDVFVHSQKVPASAFEAWVRSDDFQKVLMRRMRDLGVRSESRTLLTNAAADPGWRGLGALDAAIRLTTSLVESGGVRHGRQAAAIIAALWKRSLTDDSVIPSSFWFVSRTGERLGVSPPRSCPTDATKETTTEETRRADAQPLAGEMVVIRGAVLVRAIGPKPSEVNAGPLSPELSAALTESKPRPWRKVREILGVGHDNLERWLEAAAERIGLDSESVAAPYSEVESMLRRAGPGLIAVQRIPHAERDGYIVVLGVSKRHLKVVATDLSIRNAEIADVRDAMCREAEAPHRQPVETLLTEVGLSGRERERAAQALLAKRLTDERIGGCWLLACVVPFRLLSLAAGGQLSMEFSSSLRRRLLAGALRLDPDRVRIEGTGGLLGRVLEAETLEQLALGGGLQSLLSVVEILLAASVLASAASQWGGAALLVAFVVLADLAGSGVCERRRISNAAGGVARWFVAGEARLAALGRRPGSHRRRGRGVVCGRSSRNRISRNRSANRILWSRQVAIGPASGWVSALRALELPRPVQLGGLTPSRSPTSCLPRAT